MKKFFAPAILMSLVLGVSLVSAASNDWHVSYQDGSNALVNADIAPSAYMTSVLANDHTNGGPAFYYTDGVQLVFDDVNHNLSVGVIQPSQVNGLVTSLSDINGQFVTDEAAVASLSGTASSLQSQMTSVTSTLASSSVQRTRVQTNGTGTYTWTFPVPFATSTIPVVEVTPEDATASASTDVRITSISNTSVTVQATRITTVLGLLSLNAMPQIYVHLQAMAQ